MALIEIDASPSYKIGVFPWRTVSHNQMVVRPFGELLIGYLPCADRLPNARSHCRIGPVQLVGAEGNDAQL